MKRVIEELAELSPAELADVVARFHELRSLDKGGRRLCRNADLIRFIERHPPDPEFADDIEAGIRERRARAAGPAWTLACDW